MPIAAQHIKAALTHLKKNDAEMKLVIKQVGPFTHKLSRDRFAMLVNSILSQQISVAAARTIRSRFLELCGDKSFKAQSISQLDVEQMRAVGVSRQKAGYILDLANKTVDGTVSFRGFARMSNDEIIDNLTQVKGIGVWTAQMFLMFSMGRLDVFPVDDLGLQNAMKKIYSLKNDCPKSRFLEIAEAWSPYETIASWYCWQSLELAD